VGAPGAVVLTATGVGSSPPPITLESKEKAATPQMTTKAIPIMAINTIRVLSMFCMGNSLFE
jgi:hypothetical protein